MERGKSRSGWLPCLTACLLLAGCAELAPRAETAAESKQVSGWTEVPARKPSRERDCVGTPGGADCAQVRPLLVSDDKVDWQALRWDERIGLSWYERRAEAGDVQAMYRAGQLTERGLGTAADPARARFWYRKAAEAGHLQAQYRLALMLQQGTGGAVDDDGAVRWYRAAADQGLVQAQYNLAILTEQGRGTGKDPAAARTLYEAAVRGGIGLAAINLGGLHQTGRGTEKDLVEALAWYGYAARSGVPGAAALRDRLAGELSPEERRRAEARAETLP